MPTPQQTQAEIREHLAEQLDWRFAERNDTAVAQALYAGRAVDGVHTLDEAGLLDGFFAFLKAAAVMAVWQQFSIAWRPAHFSPHHLLCPVVWHPAVVWDCVEQCAARVAVQQRGGDDAAGVQCRGGS